MTNGEQGVMTPASKSLSDTILHYGEQKTVMTLRTGTGKAEETGHSMDISMMTDSLIPSITC